MKNAAKSTTKTRRKPASSSTRSRRQNNVPKNSVIGGDSTAAAELDGVGNSVERAAVEGETSNSVLENAGTNNGVERDVVPPEPIELTAITLHQPWASLIAAGLKQYETRSWYTDYRGLIAIHAAKKLDDDESLISLLEVNKSEVPLGAIVAVAELTDCIQMTEEFIIKQSSIEQYLGLWEVGRYAWKLENVRAIEPIPATGKQGLWKWSSDSWNPDDFGELHHKAEENGQLNLLEWKDSEQPDPDDYEFREQFEEAYKDWEVLQILAIGDSVIWCGTPGKVIDFRRFGQKVEYLIETENGRGYAQFDNQKLKKQCNQLNGLTCAVASEPDSPLLESSSGEEAPTNFANLTATVTQSLNSDIPIEQSGLTSNSSALSYTTAEESGSQNLLQQALPANPSQLMESDSGQKTIETVSPMYLEQSEDSSPNLQLSKTSEDCSTALIPLATNQEAISITCSTAYTRSGLMRNGKLSAAPTLEVPGVEKESLLLRSPGALSGGESSRPPGKSRLETQLNQLELIQDGEVAAPEFLELGYSLPIGFSNLQENRTAIELAQVQAQQQQQSIVPSSELPLATETTAIAVQPSVMPWTGESQPSDSGESNTLISLPPNIGALSKTELLSTALEQHELISSIERTEFELGIEKLHRARVTGLYLQEFKRRCRHGEFEDELGACGIKPRRAQQYMSIAKNWSAIETEAKAQTVALLVEENQSFGIKWALDTIASQKKALKSAAAPSDPDGWRTPDTRDQPIVQLVQKALGGQIYCDPCADSEKKIPAVVHYTKADDGLSDLNIWRKTVFINPPFSDPLSWVQKCYFSIARGDCSAAIMLLKAGTISNQGTGELIKKFATATCHWRGRINFLNDEGMAVKGSDFDCVFVYFGDRFDLFRSAFADWGTISTIDNHYSSINKKYFDTEAVAEAATEQSFNSTKQEEKQFAAAVGLRNGKSVLPDTRDRDREQMEQHDPNTVQTLLSQQIPTKTDLAEEESESPDSEVSLLGKTNSYSTNQQVKEAYLNDYITAVSSNLKAFSSEQIAFLYAAIASEMRRRGMELRIDFER